MYKCERICNNNRKRLQISPKQTPILMTINTYNYETNSRPKFTNYSLHSSQNVKLIELG